MQRLVQFLQQHWEASVQSFVETLETGCSSGSEYVLDWIPSNVARPLLDIFRRMVGHYPLYLTVEGLLCEVGRGLRASDPSEDFTRFYATAYGGAVRLHLSDEQHCVCIPSLASNSPPSSDIEREWVPAGIFEMSPAG